MNHNDVHFEFVEEARKMVNNEVVIFNRKNMIRSIESKSMNTIPLQTIEQPEQKKQINNNQIVNNHINNNQIVNFETHIDQLLRIIENYKKNDRECNIQRDNIRDLKKMGIGNDINAQKIFKEMNDELDRLSNEKNKTRESYDTYKQQLINQITHETNKQKKIKEENEENINDFKITLKTNGNFANKLCNEQRYDELDSVKKTVLLIETELNLMLSERKRIENVISTYENLQNDVLKKMNIE